MEILSAHELARYLDINPKKVYEYAREGVIPHTKIGGKIVFTREMIDKWIVENTKLDLSLYVAGSDDALFTAIMKAYTEQTSNFIFYAPVGSLNGLRLLHKRAANVSCVHILDVQKKEYNVGYVSRYLDDGPYSVVTMYFRQQGIYARKTDKSRIVLSDLASKHLSFINRNRGSGTRLLFDFLLNEQGIKPTDINGYETEVQSHLDAGLRVLSGEADAAFGVQYIADVLGLRFIPIFKERFDMVIPEEHRYSQQVTSLLSFFEQGRLLPYVKDFPGYDITQTGRVLKDS
jgi:putative molybdopterin biosynthesis protein